MLNTYQKTESRLFRNNDVSELPIYEQVMWLEFFQETEHLTSTLRKANELDFSDNQISSLFNDLGRSWWEQFSEIIPGDITTLVYKDMIIERLEIDQDIEITDRGEIKLEQLEHWVESNRDALGDKDYSDLTGYSSDG